jgi:hypothetical protein
MNYKVWEAGSDHWGIKRGRRPSGIAGLSLTALLMVSFTSGDGWARDQIVADSSAKVDLTVLVYIYAPIAEHDLAMAERVTSKIFQKTGVELSWVDCPMTRPTALLNPACTAHHVPTDIHLTIVPDQIAAPRVGKCAIGLAVATPPSEHAQIAYISYARAKRLLRNPRELSVEGLLGHCIAHEIGHLLLGTDSHSPSGLMSARWNPQELELIARGQLTFSIDQAVAIRGDVRARRAQREAAQSGQAASEK